MHFPLHEHMQHLLLCLKRACFQGPPPRQEEGFLQSVMLTGTQCQHHPLHRHVTEMPEPSVTQSADISLISSLVCSLSHSAF